MYVCMHACIYVCVYGTKYNRAIACRARSRSKSNVSFSRSVLLEHSSGCDDSSIVVTRHVIVYLLLSSIVGFCAWICILHCFLEPEVPL